MKLLSGRPGALTAPNIGFPVWLVGIGILVGAYATWFVAVQTGTTNYALVLLLLLSPVAAAFVTSYFAPRRKILLGMSMAVAAAGMAAALNAIFQLLGHTVDFPGTRGAVTLFVVTLTYGGLGSGVGSLAGYTLTRNAKG